MLRSQMTAVVSVGEWNQIVGSRLNEFHKRVASAAVNLNTFLSKLNRQNCPDALSPKTPLALTEFIRSSRGENGTPNAERLFPAGARKTRTFDSTTSNALHPAPFSPVQCGGSADDVGDFIRCSSLCSYLLCSRWEALSGGIRMTTPKLTIESSHDNDS